MVELNHAHRDRAAHSARARIIEDQVSVDVGRVVYTSKPDLVARGVTFDLLQMAKRVGLRCEAAEYKNLSGQKSLTLDCIANDDRRSHQAW